METPFFQKMKWIIVTAALAISFTGTRAFAGKFVAYSLGEAQRMVSSDGIRSPELKQLGGITLPMGIVHDPRSDDLVLVGETVDGRSGASLDDFVTALRAWLKHKAAPLVSIDRTPETDSTGQQKVRFDGGIEDTGFGGTILEADVILKRMGLGKLSTELWGIRSYFDLKADEWCAKGEKSPVCSRFWFKPSQPKSYVAFQKGVAVVNRLVMDVQTEVTEGGTKGSSAELDTLGTRFSAGMAAAFDDMAVNYPALARMDTLFRLSGLAEALPKWQDADGWKFKERDFWLERYPVAKHPTERTHPLIESVAKNPGGGVMRVDGGIELKALLLELEDRSITAFRDLVIRSRPTGTALTWEVPLPRKWNFHPELSPDADVSARIKSLPGVRDLGMTLRTSYDGRIPGPTSTPAPGMGMSLGVPQQQAPSFTFTDKLTSQRWSDVGGVMLQGQARIQGSERAQVELGSGGFAFVVNGKEALLDPEQYRKFVTALWAVHYGQQDPGISIDPIEPGGKKHLVRYIGKVVNTDLGRVMREADYLMKQWAVGTSRPDIAGFLNPDEISGRRGTLYYGISSRFWFVPEEMRFKEGDGMLLYDSGRMKVKTEFNLQDDRGMKSDPSNEQFAVFLTENYEKLSERYPVLGEIFEYAKLVQLSKYLKDNGVPLFWFLMANKDLVLTEDSPGTVDALAKGSDYFKNIYIEGGVDLATRGQYVFDQTAVSAIQEAASRLPVESSPRSFLGSLPQPTPYPFSFDLKGQSYSVLPQHSLTSGRDPRGTLYQTDLAIRSRGFQLTERSIDYLSSDIHRRMTYEKIRPVVERMSESELKGGFNRLLEDAWKETKGQAEAVLAKLATLKNRDYATEEAFSREAMRAVGPEDFKRYGDLMRKEAHYATSLDVVRYLSPGEDNETGQFGRGWRLLIPYRIKPAGSEKRPFLNAMIPEKMDVGNFVTGDVEVLTFSEDRYSIAGYVPERSAKTQIVGLFLLSDLSCRLRDKLGNEFQFDPEGNLTEMIFSEEHRFKIEYGYAESGSRESFGYLYRLHPLGTERASFLNVSLPKRMKVIDSANGIEETMVFNRENPYGIACYTPDQERGSRYTRLALMTDGSFVLGDIDGNEISFDPGGGFSGVRMKVVKALAQGPFRIEFQNEIQGGEPRIVEARVKQENQTDPLHIVKYEYGPDQRLCKVTRSPTKAADLSKSAMRTAARQ